MNAVFPGPFLGRLSFPFFYWCPLLWSPLSFYYKFSNVMFCNNNLNNKLPIEAVIPLPYSLGGKYSIHVYNRKRNNK